ncbi:MAG TPA: polysaccharide biosynthesis tyrosine autokinase [Azospirillaceae bacterium]|nr:polysaccharide biosynthesis tyrosine autokinase [Azospirillaceae bacterium]
MDSSQHDAPGADRGIELPAVLGALRRGWLILLVAVAVGIAGAVLTTLLATPTYRAAMAILVQPQDNPLMRPGALGTALAPPAVSQVDNHVRMLGSHTTLRAVAAALELDQDAEFAPGQPFDWLPASVRTLLPAAFETTGGWADDPAQRETALLRRLDERLEVGRDGETDVITVAFTSRDPHKAARIVSAIVESYRRSQEAEKRQSVERVRGWLAEQTGRLRAEVAEAEAMVETHRAAHRLTDGRDAVPGTTELSVLRVELNAARIAAAEKQARLRRVNELRARGDGYRPVTEVASSPVIASLLQLDDELLREESHLSQTLGDKHPRVLEARAKRERVAAKMETEVRDIVRTMEVEATAARARERELATVLDEAGRRSAAAGHAGLRSRDLEREAASRRGVYEAALLRQTEMQDVAVLAEPDAAIISPAAVPDRPVFPRLGTLLPAGAAVSLMLGIGLIALREHLDRGLRTGRQVEAALGLPAFGLVPRIAPGRTGQTPYRYLLEKPGSAYADAVQSILLRVQQAPPEAARHVLLVTSTQPGEGKTSLSLSLAAAVARTGRRTLVVDLDLRHPSIGRELGIRGKFGLLEFVAGECGLDDIIQSDNREPNLHAITLRRPVESPADILSSPRLRGLLAELRHRYDLIILDSPPALAFSDVGMAAQLADAVLFVVQWERTSGAMAANGVTALVQSRVPVIGAAVTQVDVRRHARYGYGDMAHYYGADRKYFAN